MAHTKYQIDSLLVRELSGREKIAALLKARGYTMAALARAKGYWPGQISATIAGSREYPEIRDLLATELGIDRREVDQLIEDTAA